MNIKSLKSSVQSFWNKASCGEEAHARGENDLEKFETHAKERYELEPYIHPFANFINGRGLDVLEIGVGMGADHAEWAKYGANLTGVDLTERAINNTKNRFKLLGLKSKLQTADAENLPFKDNTFDTVYSWGVIHHSPNTPVAVKEIHRVLRTGGSAKIMIYHTYALTGFMLWVRYSLLKGKWLSLAEIYSQYLESPGTKAYTKTQARKMFEEAGFQNIKIKIQLNHGDLLQGAVGQRHGGKLLTLAKACWPRWFFHIFTPFLGLYLLIEAQK